MQDEQDNLADSNISDETDTQNGVTLSTTDTPPEPCVLPERDEQDNLAGSHISDDIRKQDHSAPAAAQTDHTILSKQPVQDQRTDSQISETATKQVEATSHAMEAPVDHNVLDEQLGKAEQKEEHKQYPQTDMNKSILSNLHIHANKSILYELYGQKHEHARNFTTIPPVNVPPLDQSAPLANDLSPEQELSEKMNPVSVSEPTEAQNVPQTTHVSEDQEPLTTQAVPQTTDTLPVPAPAEDQESPADGTALTAPSAAPTEELPADQDATLDTMADTVQAPTEHRPTPEDQTVPSAPAAPTAAPAPTAQDIAPSAVDLTAPAPAADQAIPKEAPRAEDLLTLQDTMPLANDTPDSTPVEDQDRKHALHSDSHLHTQEALADHGESSDARPPKHRTIFKNKRILRSNALLRGRNVQPEEHTLLTPAPLPEAALPPEYWPADSARYSAGEAAQKAYRFHAGSTPAVLSTRSGR